MGKAFKTMPYGIKSSDLKAQHKQLFKCTQLLKCKHTSEIIIQL